MELVPQTRRKSAWVPMGTLTDRSMLAVVLWAPTFVLHRSKASLLPSSEASVANW